MNVRPNEVLRNISRRDGRGESERREREASLGTTFLLPAALEACAADMRAALTSQRPRGGKRGGGGLAKRRLALSRAVQERSRLPGSRAAAGFGRCAARRGASTPDWGAREGLRGTPERPKARDTCRSRVRRGSRPVEGPAVSGRGCPNSKQIWIEFGSNSERRDRREIEEGRSERRSTESWPILARLVRRPGLATRLWRFLKPLNYIA